MVGGGYRSTFFSGEAPGQVIVHTLEFFSTDCYCTITIGGVVQELHE